MNDALRDAVAHLAGAASAYRTYAKRHKSQGKAETDALFSTRIKDFDAAVERGRAALTGDAKTVPVPIKNVLVVLEDHGGYRCVRCVACDAVGWEEKLQHKPGCPVPHHANS